jgi:hypothetical protein
MTGELPYVEANTTSRRRLEAFVNGLSDDDLRRETPYGGTVAALLAHLAFWEERVLVLIRRWQAEGIGEAPVDADMINDALQPILLALEPRAAARLCLESAAATDALLETLTPEFVRQIEAAPVFIRLNRSLHRNAHLEDLRRVMDKW